MSEADRVEFERRLVEREVEVQRTARKLDKLAKPRRRPPATIVLRSETERQFQERVKKLARFWGWCGFHISFSQGAVTGVHLVGLGDDHYDSNGFPDWIFVRDRVIFRELKAVGRYEQPEQKRWRKKLEAAGCDVAVWRPGDEELIVSTFRGVT